MRLPDGKNISTSVLAQIFNNTSATYKYYWFISILNFVVREQRKRISFWEIIAAMIAEAWYPINYFKLSFGLSDSLYQQIVKLQEELKIPIDLDKRDVRNIITRELDNPKVLALLKVFTLNVPYRFLSPWIKFSNDRAVEERSRLFEQDSLYAIYGEEIEINPRWVSYLNENYVILRDYSFWNLSVFLQKRNPNVPDIISKLVKPIKRESLIQQRRFWNSVIEDRGSMNCIYTNLALTEEAYDLDHFIPWSFAPHNLMWNLIPVNSEINSSKSNNLPNLERYITPYSTLHYSAVKITYYRNPNNKLLEDYLSLYHSVGELVILPYSSFESLFRKLLFPLAQIAENMGYNYWSP